MKTTLTGVRVAGIAAAVPSTRLGVEELVREFPGLDVARIAERTGIHAVRIGDGLRASDLCAAAARELIGALEVVPASIDAVVFVSQTPDRVMPATSATLQHRLGLGDHVATFDLAAGCSGYVYGLLQAAMLVAGGCGRVLLLAGDVITPLLDRADHQTRMLFGDGGSATIVERGGDVASFVVRTDARRFHDLIVPRGDEPELCLRLGAKPGRLRMDPLGVVAFAIRVVPQVLKEVAALRGWRDDDVGLFALHQASKVLLDHLRNRLSLDAARAPDDMADTGNTGPASIPLLLARVAHRYAPETLARTALCGFGVGLSWGAAAVDLSRTRILSTVELEAPGAQARSAS